jgi:hypothetical protein
VASVSASSFSAATEARVARGTVRITLSLSLIRIALAGFADGDEQFGFSGRNTALLGSTVTRSGMASSNAGVIFKRPIDELQTSSIERRDVCAQCTNNILSFFFFFFFHERSKKFENQTSAHSGIIVESTTQYSWIFHILCNSALCSGQLALRSRRPSRLSRNGATHLFTFFWFSTHAPQPRRALPTSRMDMR